MKKLFCILIILALLVSFSGCKRKDDNTDEPVIDGISASSTENNGQSAQQPEEKSEQPEQQPEQPEEKTEQPEQQPEQPEEKTEQSEQQPEQSEQQPEEKTEQQVDYVEGTPSCESDDIITISPVYTAIDGKVTSFVVTPSDSVELKNNKVISYVNITNTEELKQFSSQFLSSGGEYDKYTEEFFATKQLAALVYCAQSEKISVNHTGVIDFGGFMCDTATVCKIKHNCEKNLRIGIKVTYPDIYEDNPVCTAVIAEVSADIKADRIYAEPEIGYFTNSSQIGIFVDVDEDRYCCYKMAIPEGWEDRPIDPYEYFDLHKKYNGYTGEFYRCYGFGYKFTPEGSDACMALVNFDESRAPLPQDYISTKPFSVGRVSGTAYYFADSPDLWRYIRLDNGTGHILENFGMGEWWNEKGDEALAIIESIRYEINERAYNKN